MIYTQSFSKNNKMVMSFLRVFFTLHLSMRDILYVNSYYNFVVRTGDTQNVLHKIGLNCFVIVLLLL